VGSYPTRGPAISVKYAILIDAGFLKRKLRSRARALGVEHVVAFVSAVRAHEALIGLRLHRIYWYDAPPLSITVQRPLAGGSLSLGTTPTARSGFQLLEQLSALPFFSIRQGELVFRGWRIRQGKLTPGPSRVVVSAADIEPSVHQKGVDMRLGLDIAVLSLKSHVSMIVLVAGDSDFVPAMKFARREGVQVMLVTLGHSVRQDMFEHSDLVLEIPGGANCAA
jgi:hypothetical protein